jgi:hypothetical protein
LYIYMGAGLTAASGVAAYTEHIDSIDQEGRCY